MKKYIRILTCLLALLSATMVLASAAELNKQYTYQSEDREYTVEFLDDALTAEQQESVAYNLVYGAETSSQPYGLYCILFGHELKESTVGVITHKVRTYVPRCKREIYDVTICEKCDYQTQTLSTTSYIDCCPEE